MTEEKYLKSKTVLMLTLTVLLLTLSFALIPVGSQVPIYGPRMVYLHIVNYGDPSTEFAALELDEIDTTDWPLTPTWVEKFSVKPEITMTDFT